MRAFKIITGTGTPALTKLGDAVSLQGVCASNAETSTTIYLKLWWQTPGNTTLPIIGTTAPSVTIPIPSTGQPLVVWNQPLNMGGPAWMAVTKLAADTDTTALATGGEVVTLFLD